MKAKIISILFICILIALPKEENMKAKIISILFICILIALPMSKADAIIGTPDKVPAATLIVPLMESSAVGGPENTLIVVDHLCFVVSPQLHWVLVHNFTGYSGT